MEEDDNSISSNQSNENGDQHPIMQQFPRTTNRKQSQSHLFWYDIRNFPDSLLIEILARLPLKSIFRFKSVCKNWQTLISHPSFRRFYISILNSNTNAASSSSLPFRILYRSIYLTNFKGIFDLLGPEIYTCSESSLLLLTNLKEEGQRSYEFKVLAVSNGLILCCLLCSSCRQVYYVCDPVTRQWITLPRSRARRQLFFGEGLIARVNQDHMLTDYTVVRIKISGSSYLKIEVFSSKIGDWVSYKLYCVNPLQLLKPLSGAPIQCYGAFHWLTHNRRILAFDPYKDPKSSRLISLPNDRDIESEINHDRVFQLCDECQGTLRYFEVAHDPTKLNFLTMWSMKDYEKGEWCCEFKVRRNDLHPSDPELSDWLMNGTFLPLLFHPLNLNVVYLNCLELGWILSYNFLNRRLDVACKMNVIVDDLDVSWRMVIPFLLPKWRMPLPTTPRCASLPPPPPPPPSVV